LDYFSFSHLTELGRSFFRSFDPFFLQKKRKNLASLLFKKAEGRRANHLIEVTHIQDLAFQKPFDQYSSKIVVLKKAKMTKEIGLKIII
jgi:hypothetical protein